MRGSDAGSGSLFSYVDLESRVPTKHPLRVIKGIVDDVLASLDAAFERLYEGTGRQLIAPERLLRASLLQAFYSVRSERQLMEQIAVPLVRRAPHRRCRVGSFDILQEPRPPARRRRRRQVPRSRAAASQGQALPLRRSLLGVGPLVEAWASLKSFRARDGSDEPPAPGRNGERDFHGEKRKNDTHESKTDPEAKLLRKGHSQPSKLYFMGHALIENRHGLVVQADATQATGKAERQAALSMIDRLRASPHARRRQGYDTSDFVADLRQKCVTPHVAVRFKFTFAMVAYNLIRMPRLLATA